MACQTENADTYARTQHIATYTYAHTDRRTGGKHTAAAHPPILFYASFCVACAFVICLLKFLLTCIG